MGYYHPQLVTIFTKATRLASAQRPVGNAKGRLDIFWESLVTWKGRFARVSMELAVVKKFVNLSGWHVTSGWELVRCSYVRCLQLMYSRALGIKIIYIRSNRTKKIIFWCLEVVPLAIPMDPYGLNLCWCRRPFVQKVEWAWLVVHVDAWTPEKMEVFHETGSLFVQRSFRENFWDPNWWLRKILPDGLVSAGFLGWAVTSPTQHSQHAQVQGYGYILFAPLGGRVVVLLLVLVRMNFWG